MSYHVGFMFSSGLAKPIKAPRGTHQRILDHVQDVEQKLHLVTTQYRDNPPHWDSWKRDECAAMKPTGSRGTRRCP